MAFKKKTWKARKSEYPNRRMLTKENGSAELVTVAREEGIISEEGDAFSPDTMNDLEERIENAITATDTEVAALKKSVSDGKKTVAAAITAEGVSTAADATFAVMAANVGKVADNQYRAGVAAADDRVNSSSASYTSGRTQG